MATGHILSKSEELPIPLLTGNFNFLPSVSHGLRTLFDVSGNMHAGPLEDNLPIEMPEANLDGVIVASYFEDYYNRIWFIPTAIDLGAVSAEVQRTFVVWNAYYRDEVVLLSIVADNVPGLTLSGSTIPYTFAPMELVQYTINASTEGPAAINATYTFQFDTPLTFNLNVVGTRAKTYPFVPNWTSPYTITYEYWTEILTSRSGKEQRLALRYTPRKRIEFQCLLKGDGLRQFNGLMWSWQDRTFALPEYTRFATSAVQMEPQALQMVLTSMPNWVLPNTAVILMYLDLGLYELRTIDAVSGNTVTFGTTSGTSFPVGTKMHLALSGNVSTSMPALRRTNTTAQVSVVFDVQPLSEVIVPFPPPGIVFNGKEVFMFRPNWIGPVDITMIHEVDVVDFNRGPVQRYSPIDFGTELWRAQFLGKTFFECEQLRNFFDRQKGQRGEFYMPTREYDIIMKITAPETTASLRVAGTIFNEQYSEDTVHRALCVFLTDGTYIFNTVLDITAVSDSEGEDTLITVGTTWTIDLTKDNVQMISWMPCWRCASDSLTIEWLTESIAQAQFAVQTVEDLPVDEYTVD